MKVNTDDVITEPVLLSVKKLDEDMKINFVQNINNRFAALPHQQNGW